MILESDTADGVCNGCKEEFTYTWGVSFADQLARHDCGNKTQLQLSRLASIQTKLDALIEGQAELREAIADLYQKMRSKARTRDDDTDS